MGRRSDAFKRGVLTSTGLVRSILKNTTAEDVFEFIGFFIVGVGIVIACVLITTALLVGIMKLVEFVGALI